MDELHQKMEELKKDGKRVGAEKQRRDFSRSPFLHKSYKKFSKH